MWSCETQLMVTAHDIVKNLAQGDQVDLVSLDFSKAFDRVPHRQLLQKLHCYRVRNNTLSWIQVFLTSKSQQVVLERAHSSLAPVLSGAPKVQFWDLFCLWLTSTIFLMQSSPPSSDCSQMTASSTGKSATRNCCNRTYSALRVGKTLGRWASTPASATPSNLTKQTKEHTPNNLPSPWTTTSGGELQKIPGGNDHRWPLLNRLYAENSEMVVAKGNRTLGFLPRSFQGCTTKVRSATYITMVCPMPEYTSTVWDPLKQKDAAAWKGTASSSKVCLQQLKKQDAWYHTIAVWQSEMEQPWTTQAPQPAPGGKSAQTEWRQNRSSSLSLFVFLETFYRSPPWLDYSWLSQHPLLWFCQEPWIHSWLKTVHEEAHHKNLPNCLFRA